jgi:CheY-like chemotaxis protein
MPADVMASAFEPFFTTKGIGQGTGLGLSQVYGFAKQSGGHAAIYSEIGEGTTIKLNLPRHRGAVETTAAVVTEAPMPERATGQLILVVEDDDSVRDFTATALRDSGYHVIHAPNADVALRLVEQHPEIALLFTDIVLTGSINGRQLADEIVRRRPGLPVLYTTGYTRNAIIHHGRLDEGIAFIGKPFTVQALSAKVSDVLASTARDSSRAPASKPAESGSP